LLLPELISQVFLAFGTFEVSNELQITRMSQLPPWVCARIAELGVTAPEHWIQEAIPALQYRSIAQLAASEAGQAELRSYFNKVIGRF
jgi:hypothetical protein